MKCQSYKLDIQPFLSVSQVSDLCIVHNVPLPFVDVVSLTYMSNYGREDVGASACCLSLNGNTVEGCR